MTADVPYLSKSTIAAEAGALLVEFGRAHYPVIEPPVPLEEIVEFYLQIEFAFEDLRTLLGRDGVLGATWFQERRIAIDIGINPTDHPAMRSRYHYTLAHEIGHWCLHRKLFLRRTGCRSPARTGATSPDTVFQLGDTKSRVEWQADYFAAQLVMPRAMVQDAWEQWRSEPVPITLGDLARQKREILKAEQQRRRSAWPGTDAEDDVLLEHVSRPLAEQFQVSPEAMRIRLEDLGYLLRRPAASLRG